MQPGGLDGDRLVAEPLLLSPHPDDAVFSAWHVLTSPGPLGVLTVFAGVPARGFVTPLDRAHGAAESAAWVRRRLKEDGEVLGAIGRRSEYLDFLDVQYRVLERPSLLRAIERDPQAFVTVVSTDEASAMPAGVLDEPIRERLRPGVVVYAPAGIGDHPDHVAVAGVASRLHQAGVEVHLYADSPYFVRFGLPTWLGGVAQEDVDRQIERALNRLGPSALTAERHVIRLSDAEVAAKIRAAKGYRTEFRFVDADFAGMAEDPEFMRFEVEWVLEPHS